MKVRTDPGIHLIIRRMSISVSRRSNRFYQVLFPDGSIKRFVLGKCDRALSRVK